VAVAATGEAFGSAIPALFAGVAFAALAAVELRPAHRPVEARRQALLPVD
jgi:hypothetical protein